MERHVDTPVSRVDEVLLLRRVTVVRSVRDVGGAWVCISEDVFDAEDFVDAEDTQRILSGQSEEQRHAGGRRT